MPVDSATVGNEATLLRARATPRPRLASSAESRWQVEVSGKLATATLLPRHLPLFQVRCDSAGTAFISHRELEPLGSPQSVRMEAVRLIDKANAALAVAMLAPPALLIGRTIRQRIPGGEVICHRFEADDEVPAPLPLARAADPGEERTQAERAIALANADHRFAAATARMGVAEHNLFELEDVFELIHKAVCAPGAERMALARGGWTTQEDLEAFHEAIEARRNPQPKPARMNPATARALVRRLLIAWLDRAMPS